MFVVCKPPCYLEAGLNDAVRQYVCRIGRSQHVVGAELLRQTLVVLRHLSEPLPAACVVVFPCVFGALICLLTLYQIMSHVEQKLMIITETAMIYTQYKPHHVLYTSHNKPDLLS